MTMNYDYLGMGAYNRTPNFDEPIDKCVFTCQTDLSQFGVTPLVTNYGKPTLLNHEITLITGNECSRTAHFAKMLAATVLSNGEYPFAASLNTSIKGGHVLWIDSINSIHTVTYIMNEFKSNLNITPTNFKMVCLDCLGTFHNRPSVVANVICSAIASFKPNLIVINDIDNLFPGIGYNDSVDFVSFLRDFTSHENTAVCAIGHNLIGKVKNTTGFIGNMLLPIATNIFRVSDYGASSRVTCFKSLIQTPYEFTFVINEQNMPQEVIRTPKLQKPSDDFIDTTTLQDVFAEALKENNDLSAMELTDSVNSKLMHMARQRRARMMIADALIRGIITRDPVTGKYSATPEVNSVPDPYTACILPGTRFHEMPISNIDIISNLPPIINDPDNMDLKTFNTSPDPQYHDNPI